MKQSKLSRTILRCETFRYLIRLHTFFKCKLILSVNEEVTVKYSKEKQSKIRVYPPTFFFFFFFWRVFLRKHFSKRENNLDRKMKRLSITKEESLCLLCQFHYFVAIYLLVFKFLFLSNIRSDLLWSTLTFLAWQKEPLSKVTTSLTENLVFDIKVLGSKAGG